MTNDIISPSDTSRRDFLKKIGLATATAGLITQPAFSALAMPQSRVKMGGECRDVCLYNANTRESINTVFYAHGEYNKQSFNQLCHFLRDCRENQAHWMDPRVLTLLYDMQTIFDRRQIHVISGYRTARTNAMLSRTTRGVAKDSFHMRGQAIDIRIPGIETSAVRDVAKILGVGGVGYYPASHFVHVDTGPVRTW